jgi:transcription antitermination factor NusA-like protein
MRNNEDDDSVPSNMSIRALVSTKEAGIIIGKSGKNVNEIREQSGSRVNISEIVPGATERVLTITGRLDTIAKVRAGGDAQHL